MRRLRRNETSTIERSEYASNWSITNINLYVQIIAIRISPSTLMNVNYSVLIADKLINQSIQSVNHIEYAHFIFMINFSLPKSNLYVGIYY